MVRAYLCDWYTPEELLYQPLIALAMGSVAKMCIIPLQDYLGLDNSSRINTPATIGINWRWRVKAEQLTEELKQEVLSVTKRYGRAN